MRKQKLTSEEAIEVLFDSLEGKKISTDKFEFAIHHAIYCIDWYEKLNYVTKEYETYIKSCIGEKEFNTLSTRIAKDLFKMDMEKMKDSDFKKFLQDHFEEITEES